MNKKQVCYVLLTFWATQNLFGHEHGDKSGGVKSLDVCLTKGKQHLLIGEGGAKEDQTRLLYLSSTDDGRTWSEPVQVNTEMPAPHGIARGADAQIAAAGNHLVAVWQTAGGDAYGGGPMATALSSDGGKTWRAGPKPADDSLNIGHGYIDITADERGTFHLVWLDSRNGKQGLYYARSDDGGEHWSKNVTIDPRTCECCWNAIAAHDNKLFVLYRQPDPRDMALAVSDDNGSSWRKASTVGAFDWHFNGCPEVGGALAFTPNKSFAVTWTGKPDVAGVYAWQSTDGGASWTSRKLGSFATRNPDIAASGNELAAVWDENGREIVAAVSTDFGNTWKTQRIAEVEEGANHPRILGAANGFRVFWTQSDAGKISWRSAELKAATNLKSKQNAP